MTFITSTHHAAVKAARRLRSRSYRDRDGLLLLEGPTLVSDAAAAGAQLEQIFVTPALAPPVPNIPVLRVSPAVLAEIADTVTPQGVVAVARQPAASLDDALQRDGVLVVLADVRDPGNAGTLVRAAAAAGAAGVVFPRGAVDAFNPKLVRAAAGAHWRIPIVRGGETVDVLRATHAAGRIVRLAVATGGQSVWDANWRVPACLVLGNEAAGLPDSVAGERVTIPMAEGAESLNVGVAGAVILFEAARQRAVSA